MNSELSYASQPVNSEPEPMPKNIFSRLVGIWFSPTETFAEIGRAPRVLIPTLLMVILAGATNYVVISRYGYENIVRKQIESMANAGFMPQDRAEEAIQQATSPSRITAGKIQGVAFAGIGIVVFLLITAGLFKLFSLMMGTENRFKQVYSVTVYAFLAIALISTVILLLSIYLKDPADLDIYNPIGSNLGALLPMMIDRLPKFVLGLASFVDVFGIWRLALLAIGYAAVTRKMKTSTAASFLVVLYIIVALIGAAFSSFFG